MLKKYINKTKQMSLLDKASLIVTPNAYKESKLYSVVPSSGAGDMDVVRATTATRVNSAGLIEVVPRNLVTYSEQFDNANWGKYQTSITANTTTAPNGTLTADTITDNTANDVHIINQAVNISAGTYTMSVYAKLNTLSNINLQLYDGVSSFISSNVFNLSSGTTSGANQSILNVGNGWYKCSFTITTTQTGTQYFYVVLNNGSSSFYTGTGKSLFIWGYQVEQGSTATEYFPTTTRLNIPRIDYTNGSCPSLLVEPQRTNLFTYSEQFDNAAWSKINSSITANSAISPDGSMNADKIVENNINAAHFVLKSSSYTGTNTLSVFLKKSERDKVIIQLATASLVYYAKLVDLTNGTLLTPPSPFTNITTSSIKNFGNGWFRIDMTLTDTIIETAFFLYNGSSYSYTGDGTSGCFIYGAQLEAGSYSTSYIPTIASTVTRNADVISKTGISSLIGQTEGTLFTEIKLQNVNSQSIYAVLSSGSFANAILIGKEAGVTPNKLMLYINASGSNILFNTSVSLSSNYVKCAIAYKSGDWAAYVNGNLIASGTSTFSFSSSLDRFGFANNGALDVNIEKIEVKSAQLYKTRLTNTELAQLTTL